MSVANRLRLYFGSKYLILFIVLCSSFLAMKQEKDAMTIIILYITLMFEGLAVFIWSKVNFFKKCDLEKSYIEFLNVFIKINKIYLPRFIYGDFLYNFVTFYKTNYKIVKRFDFFFLDNYDYMHSLIAVNTSSGCWVLSEALYDKNWFCNQCVLLKKAYEQHLYGNELIIHMGGNIEATKNEEKVNRIIKWFVIFIVIVLLPAIIHCGVSNENLRNVLYAILAYGVIPFWGAVLITDH